MCIEVNQWRSSIGLHYVKTHGVILHCRYYWSLESVFYCILSSLISYTLRCNRSMVCFIRQVYSCFYLCFLHTTANFILISQVGLLSGYTNSDDVCLRTSLLLYFLSLTILLSNDVEKNPGPEIDGNNNISIIHLNVRSIRNKFDYIVDFMSDFDILCFTETHFTNEINDNDIQIENYDTFYRKDLNSYTGGILVYIENNLVQNVYLILN